MIKVVYTNIQSKVKIDGLLCDRFILVREVCQASLLSMLLYHCIISFSTCSEKMFFPKKLHWNMIFLVLSGKTILLHPENMILFFRRKLKDDISQKIHANKIFSSNVLKRWSFQKNRAGVWYFLQYLERWYFFFPENVINFL